MSAETPRTPSRLRVSPEFRGALSATALQPVIALPRANRFSGDLAERNRVAQAIDYLRRVDGIREGNSWENLLAGDTSLSEGGVRLDTKRCIKLAGAANDTRVMSLGGAVKGPDYAALKREHPTERYKFYHSIQDPEQGEAYLTDLIGRASKQGLSMTMKTFDHSYDSANVYTYHPKEMAALIAETYPSYKGAFLDTEHFLQGGLEGVDPQHIGWVQEPSSGDAGSHSVRMGRLGEVLDQEGFTEDAYRLGCERAGVIAATPWLLNEAALRSVAVH